MADVHNKATRSYNMSQIKGKDTKPELVVRKFLFSKGFRYRLNDKSLPGNPDIVLSKYKTVIFINGCFWHAHEGCKYFVIPKTKTEWWTNKINANKARDIKQYTALENSGWRVILLWECDLTSTKCEPTLNKAINMIKNL